MGGRAGGCAPSAPAGNAVHGYSLLSAPRKAHDEKPVDPLRQGLFHCRRLALGELAPCRRSGQRRPERPDGLHAAQSQPADVPAAERYYDTALHIDPKHRAALEQSGELYLLTDRLLQVEQHSAARPHLFVAVRALHRPEVGRRPV